MLIPCRSGLTLQILAIIGGTLASTLRPPVRRGCPLIGSTVELELKGGATKCHREGDYDGVPAVWMRTQ